MVSRDRSVCIMVLWSVISVMQVYGVFLMMTQFVLPLLVSSLAYIMIISKLSLRTGVMRAGAGRSTIRSLIF